MDKVCSKCRLTKLLDEFPKSHNRPGGLYDWCKSCNAASSHNYYIKNKELVNKRRRDQKQANKLAWQNFFVSTYGSSPRCQICDVDLVWNTDQGTNNRKVVNWDHRHGDHAGHINPANWLCGHICNDKNQETWKSFDFGILCSLCNGSLPTLNRKQWLERAFEYLEVSAWASN